MSGETTAATLRIAQDVAAMTASLLIGAKGDATRAMRLLDEMESSDVNVAVRAGIRAAVDELGRRLNPEEEG